MQLKPQDFLVALKLVALGAQRWTYASLAQGLGLSASDVHAAVKRGLAAGLLLENRPPPLAAADGLAVAEPLGIYRVTRKRAARAQAQAAGSGVPGQPASDNPARVHAQNLAEFALHGAKYAFPAARLPLAVGVPTSHSAPVFDGVFAPGSTPFVWPHPNGQVRGIGVEPLHPAVPFAATQDRALYDLLALFDALRVGKVREKALALQRLQALIDPSAPAPEPQAQHG